MDQPDPALTAPRLGELLESARIITHRDLEAALAVQAERNERLGKLLVEKGLLDDLELKAVLELQRDLQGGQLAEVVGFVSTRLGSVLCSARIATPEQVDAALVEQERTGRALGDILVASGAVDAAQLERALELQRSYRQRAGERLRLGRILVDAGLIDEATLASALDTHHRTGRKLGGILVEIGAITRQSLDKALARQRRLIAVAMCVVAAAAPALAPSMAIAGDTHKVLITVQVLRLAAISAIRSPSSITLTQADIARGYVELADEFEIDIKTNDPAGVLLGIVCNNSAIQAAELWGDGTNIRAAGVWVPKVTPGLTPQTVRMRARLKLAADAQPGAMSWPLGLYIVPG